MSSFINSIARIAVLDDSQVAQPWPWRPDGEELEVRNALHLTYELENRQATAALASGLGEVAFALAQAQAAAGDLAGLLVAQDGSLFDRPPAPGEWTVRETLRHTVATEARFRVWTLWFAEHGAESNPTLDLPEPELSGDAGAIIDELMRARAATDEAFEALKPGDLDKPGRWAGHPVDLRFRLHRHASHLVEHTIQCEKVLHGLDADPAEARQMVRAIWAARGAHERHSDPAAIARLDEGIAQKVGSFGL